MDTRGLVILYVAFVVVSVLAIKATQFFNSLTWEDVKGDFVAWLKQRRDCARARRY